MIIFAFIIAHFVAFSFCKSITISWSTPEEITKPATGKETLLAIRTHLQAFHLANVVPRLLSLESEINIKLCPPQPYDPLVKEFTVPRLNGYSLLYDHDCIQRGQEGLEAKWGSKPKQPAPEKPQLPPVYGTKGLSVPKFIHKLYKQKGSKEELNSDHIWLIDSDSLRSWFTAPTLNYLFNHKSFNPPADLMRQINSMYGSIGEKDLKNMPQAVQGALLIALPDYSAWSKDFSHKSLFNPTWWITRAVPREQQQIIELMKKVIESSRLSGQLIIIHHDPTPFNFDIIASLTAIYGEKNLISSTKVLPKTFTTFQLLQFMQKAAVLVVDSRDLLGQMGLLATGFTTRVHLMQNHLAYTTAELILISTLATWFFAVLLTRIFYTHKHYNEPLDTHLLHFALFTILAVTPVIVLTPSMWPKYISMAVYSIFEAGYEAVLYGILVFYLTAGFITIIIVLFERFKQRRIQNFDEEDEGDSENDNLSETESSHLVPKKEN